MNIEHVGLYAEDPSALAEWYQKILGLEVVRKLEKEGRPPVFFLKGTAGAQLEILPTQNAAGEKTVDRSGYTHLGIVIDDFESFEKGLVEQGIELWGVRDTSNGWRIGYFNDPEGNILEIVRR